MVNHRWGGPPLAAAELAIYNNAQTSKQFANYIQTYVYWLRAYLQTQLLHEGHMFFNFTAHDFNPHEYGSRGLYGPSKYIFFKIT